MEGKRALKRNDRLRFMQIQRLPSGVFPPGRSLLPSVLLPPRPFPFAFPGTQGESQKLGQRGECDRFLGRKQKKQEFQSQRNMMERLTRRNALMSGASIKENKCNSNRANFSVTRKCYARRWLLIEFPFGEKVDLEFGQRMRQLLHLSDPTSI